LQSGQVIPARVVVNNGVARGAQPDGDPSALIAVHAIVRDQYPGDWRRGRGASHGHAASVISHNLVVLDLVDVACTGQDNAVAIERIPRERVFLRTVLDHAIVMDGVPPGSDHASKVDAADAILADNLVAHIRILGVHEHNANAGTENGFCL
jgi:hypothetical protein